MNQNNVAIITGAASGIGRATAIVWLCSDEASFITGHTLLANGGYTSK